MLQLGRVNELCTSYGHVVELTDYVDKGSFKVSQVFGEHFSKKTGSGRVRGCDGNLLG